MVRILMAEDQEQLAHAVGVVLEMGGFSVDVATDGVEALGMLRNGEYDGVLLDVMMPRMDGWEVLARLREDGNQVPVMMLTARDTIDDKVRGLEGGADDYMTKPFEMRELVARIRAMTRTRAVETANTLAMGDLTLRRSSMELMSADGSSFRLTAKEFTMAEMLAHGNGHPIAPERFAEKLWPRGDADVPELAVGLHVAYLRNKMAVLHSSRTIANVGDGYALVPADATGQGSLPVGVPVGDDGRVPDAGDAGQPGEIDPA